MENVQRVIRCGLTSLLLAGLLFFAGQFIAQWATTQPYSMSRQAISDLGVTSCGSYTEYATKQIVHICSPLHLVMDGTFVVYGALIMLGTSLGLRFVWPSGRFRKTGLTLLFFGGIEAVVSGFSPQNLAPFLHRLSGGLAMVALNLGLVLLGIAAKKKRRALGWATLLVGLAGLIGLLIDGGPTYPGLGYGGWERVAGYAFAFWAIGASAYLMAGLRKAGQAGSAAA